MMFFLLSVVFATSWSRRRRFKSQTRYTDVEVSSLANAAAAAAAARGGGGTDEG
jgi:hypothetical protein